MRLMATCGTRPCALPLPGVLEALVGLPRVLAGHLGPTGLREPSDGGVLSVLGKMLLSMMLALQALSLLRPTYAVHSGAWICFLTLIHYLLTFCC